jgi:uncharacterized membrane protein (UPF0127 family)
MRSAVTASLLAFLAVVFVACGGDPATLPTTTISFTNDAGARIELLVEIADTPEKRARGLMFRESLPEDRGMLFDFGGVETQSGFWMKGTTIPLSIAFISVDDTIIHIQDMEPLSLELHRSDQPYEYAIEVNRGWFEANGIGVGAAVGQWILSDETTDLIPAYQFSPTPVQD